MIVYIRMLSPGIVFILLVLFVLGYSSGRVWGKNGALKMAFILSGTFFVLGLLITQLPFDYPSFYSDAFLRSTAVSFLIFMMVLAFGKLGNYFRQR